MKNKQLFATFALVLSSVILSSCGNEVSSVITSSSDSTSSSSSLPEIHLEDSELYYLCGTFHGINGTLTINSKSAVLEGPNTSFNLKPTSIKEEKISSSLTTLTLYFDGAYNEGTTYRAYVDLEGDGLLHFQEAFSNGYMPFGTYQPDIAEYQGVYSSYGDSDQYNTYYVISNEFDTSRNGFVTDHVSTTSWSYEQSWLGKTRIRGTKEESYITYEEIDSDGDSWGEYQLIKEENRVRFYDRTYEYDNSVTDFGIIQNLQIFDGTNTISIGADLEEGILYYGEKEGTLEIKNDENGFYVESTIDEKVVKIRIFHHYITYEVDGKTTIYPIDDTSEMQGTYTDKTTTIAYLLDWETEEYTLEVNGEPTTFSYVISDNRKAISFVKDNKTYIVTPEKNGTAIKVSVDNKSSYYLNDNEFKEVFAHTYYIHEDGEVKSFIINDDLTYVIGDKQGQATYQYSHGSSYPSLKIGDNVLFIDNQTIGLFSYNDNDDFRTVYTKEALEKVYGTYSSNGVDTLKIDENYVTIGTKQYEYNFASYQPSEDTLTQFALTLKGTSIVIANNLYGTTVVVEDDVESKYYVKKDIFTSIVGTYSAYGTYGIENIKISSEGKLTLDTTNADNTGLDRDVEYPYYIVTNEMGDYVAQIIFTYKNNKIALNVYEDHVSIGALSYYDSTLVNSWGIYTDEAKENIVLIRNNEVLVNGTKIEYSSIEENDTSITYTTSTGSLVITKGTTYGMTYTDGENVTTLSRSLSFIDYSKFNGTYTINDQTLVFSKDSTGLNYQAAIDESTIVSFNDMNVSIKDGGICLEISTFSGKYYLNLDLTTSSVTTSYEASSIPTPPPFPGL